MAEKLAEFHPNARQIEATLCLAMLWVYLKIGSVSILSRKVILGAPLRIISRKMGKKGWSCWTSKIQKCIYLFLSILRCFLRLSKNTCKMWCRMLQILLLLLLLWCCCCCKTLLYFFICLFLKWDLLSKLLLNQVMLVSKLLVAILAFLRCWSGYCVFSRGNFNPQKAVFNFHSNSSTSPSQRKTVGNFYSNPFYL